MSRAASDPLITAAAIVATAAGCLGLTAALLGAAGGGEGTHHYSAALGIFASAAVWGGANFRRHPADGLLLTLLALAGYSIVLAAGQWAQAAAWSSHAPPRFLLLGSAAGLLAASLLGLLGWRGRVNPDLERTGPGR